MGATVTEHFYQGLCVGNTDYYLTFPWSCTSINNFVRNPTNVDFHFMYVKLV